MKIGICSDVHLEFGSSFEIDRITKGVDVAVVAGDLHPGAKVREKWLKPKVNKCPVLFVHGNHDYWYTKKPDLNHGLVRFEHTVNNQTIVFAGATLWTDFLNNELAMIRAPKIMNDYKFIKNLTPSYCKELHDYHKNWLKNQHADVIISHHRPIYEMRDRNFLHDQEYYVSDMINDILYGWSVKPKLWIAGHSHSFFDETIDGVRFVSNPFGYPLELYMRSKDYKNLIIDI